MESFGKSTARAQQACQLDPYLPIGLVRGQPVAKHRFGAPDIAGDERSPNLLE
jgi:hypothetical protein